MVYKEIFPIWFTENTYQITTPNGKNQRTRTRTHTWARRVRWLRVLAVDVCLVGRLVLLCCAYVRDRTIWLLSMLARHFIVLSSVCFGVKVTRADIPSLVLAMSPRYGHTRQPPSPLLLLLLFAVCCCHRLTFFCSSFSSSFSFHCRHRYLVAAAFVGSYIKYSWTQSNFQFSQKLFSTSSKRNENRIKHEISSSNNNDGVA